MIEMQEKTLKLNNLLSKIEIIYKEALHLEDKFASQLQFIHPFFKDSTANQLHYLALRQHDIRELQQQLAYLGLSSLARSEALVLASLYAVQAQLKLLKVQSIGSTKPAFSSLTCLTQLLASEQLILSYF